MHEPLALGSEKVRAGQVTNVELAVAVVAVTHLVPSEDSGCSPA